jgi:hypothetical protein
MARSLPVSAQYADASELEKAVNARILKVIESIFGDFPAYTLQEAIEVIRDALFEARKLHRYTSGSPLTIQDWDLDIGVLLLNTPLQLWPLPCQEQCFNVHCKEFPSIRDFDAHMRHHGRLFEAGFLSAAVWFIVGVTGMRIRAVGEGDKRCWACPFGGCQQVFQSHSRVILHVNEHHDEVMKTIYTEMGSFWASVLHRLHVNGRWPTLKEILSQGGLEEHQLIQMTGQEAEITWKKNRNVRPIPARSLQSSPIEDILFDFCRWTTVEGVEERARGIACRIYSEYGALPEDAQQKLIGEELERENAEWYAGQQGWQIQVKKEPDEWEASCRAEEERVRREREETMEIERRRQEERQTEARTWIEESEQEETKIPENRETEREEDVWADIPNAEELSETEHEELEPEREHPPRIPPPGFEPLHPERRKQIEWQKIEQKWPEVAERAEELREILSCDRLEEVQERLEEFLERVRSCPIPRERRKDQTLDDPLLVVIVQNNCHRICRTVPFCPFPECTAKVKTVPGLMTHVKNKHDLRGEIVRSPDMVRFYIASMYPYVLETRLETMEGRRVERVWDLERCYFPNCGYIQERHHCVHNHVTKGHKNQANVEALGWFWGTLRAVVKEDPRITVREMLRDGEVYQCGAQGCEGIFWSEAAVRKHFAQKHSDQTQEGWEAPWDKLKTRSRLINKEERASREVERHSNQQVPKERIEKPQENQIPVAEIIETRRQKKAQSDEEGILCVDHQSDEQGWEDKRRSEEEQATLRREYIKKREECLGMVHRGVNIPQLNKGMIRAIKPGLMELFKFELNPALEEMMPEKDDWDGWLAFEGAYEEAQDKMRRHIYTALTRNPARIYGRRPVDPKIQAMREERSEAIRQIQTTRVQLSMVKAALEEISRGEGESEEAEQRRRKTRWTEKIIPILRTIPEKRRMEVFGTTELTGLWNEMNTAADHRQKVVDWVESLIVMEVAGEIEGLGKQMQAERVREAYRTTKSIAMKRYVDKKNSPQCDISKEEVQSHYQKIWAQPAQHFKEAEVGNPLFLERRIPEDATEEMEEYMTEERNIAAVIKSRQDLSACGPDGISYRILKLAGEEGVKFMKLIIQASIRCGRIITSWKEARTILIHKKGDKAEIQNWRPISITNCAYRIYTCLMARCFQQVNGKYRIYSDVQKGFIQKTNGCTEHGIILNELFQHAKRSKRTLAMTAIDFANAFGSVPHELIMSTMRQRNFPAWTVKIVEDMYTGASSTVELKGERSDAIPWKCGVKQGCPLSPLLFNLCLEPLLQLLQRANRGEGFAVRAEDREVEFIVQAYADDVILISETPAGIESMLRSLTAFVKWAKMTVNARKCVTATYLLDSNGRRSSLRDNLKFNEQEIPNLTLSQSLKYLGTPVTARKTVKLQAVNQKIAEVEILLEKIMKSALLTVQKIDAVKTFLLPSMDFMMLNGEVGKAQLTKMDQKIRGAINEQLKIRGLPVECHHMSWRDGGLSYPSLVDRSSVLTLRSFAQMVLSQDRDIQDVMERFIIEERNFRKIEVETEGEPLFLNWKNGKGKQAGTTSIVAKSWKAARKLGVRVKVVERAMVLGREGSEYKTTNPAGIGRFLTQRIIRPRLAQKVMEHELHGASFSTLKGNEISNRFLTNIYTKRSDALFRFAVAGRADCLPTPANVNRWFGRREEECRRCGQNEKATMAHIMNQCKKNAQLFTKRHNRLVEVVRKVIEQIIGEEMIGVCLENAPLNIEGLSETVKMQRPDLTIIRRDGQKKRMELIEITCPYGRIAHGQDTLKYSFDYKMNKYQKLVGEVEKITGMRTRVIPIVVSSFGAVYTESMKLLKKLLKCEDKKLKKIGRRMSDAVIIGSFEIWKEYIAGRKAREGENKEEAELIEEEQKQENSGFADDEWIDDEEEEEEADIGQARQRDESAERMAAVLETEYLDN